MGWRGAPGVADTLLAELGNGFDPMVASEAERLFHLREQPITKMQLRALFEWLEIVRVTRPIQLSVSKFDRMVAQLCKFEQMELTADLFNLLFGHLVSRQAIAPNQFTQAAADKALVDALSQIRATSERLRSYLTQPQSQGFKRLFDSAIAQCHELKLVHPNHAELRAQVAARAQVELFENQLVSRHQIVSKLAKVLGQLAADQDGGVRLRCSQSSSQPPARLIQLTQISPNQLPE